VQRSTGQLGGQHRLGRDATARGVGQWRDPEATEQIEHAGAASHIDPAQRDGGQFGADATSAFRVPPDWWCRRYP